MWRVIPLLPILAAQGLWVAARAARLPEAAGPRKGTSGHGPGLRLLVLGDSSAAGVGVATQDAALAGAVVRGLARDFRVTWRLLARTGGTVASTRRLLDEVAGERFDVAVIALGVNDTKNGISLRRWQSGYAALIEDLRAAHGLRLVCASGVPPLGDFPLLPAPLRRILGMRAARFDAVLRNMAADDAALLHIPFEGVLDPGKMAPDGFHPGPEIYADWGKQVSETLRRALTARSVSRLSSRSARPSCP